MVAHQPVVGRVIGQLDGAPGAFRHLSALSAGHHPACPPAIEEQNGLLPPLQIDLQLPAQHAADGGVIALTQLLLHIHHQDLGQRPLIVAPAHGKQMQLSLPGQIHGLHRRSRRPQHQQGPMLHTAVLGHISGVVAGGVFRLVAALLLLIQNDQAQTLQRGKHRRAGAHHHAGLSPPNPLPLVIALPRPQRAVEHSHLLSKMGSKNP